MSGTGATGSSVSGSACGSVWSVVTGATGPLISDSGFSVFDRRRRLPYAAGAPERRRYPPICLGKYALVLMDTFVGYEGTNSQVIST